LVADEVVMVILRLGGALVADHRLPDVDALDETQPVELVEDPIDAGAADATGPPATQGILDLKSGQRAALTGEQLEHGAARTAPLAARLGERQLGPLHPARRAHARIVEA
jgi:hypothetical protein